MTQQNCTIQNFDLALLDQLRADADTHAIDMSRVKIQPLGDGRYTVNFGTPQVDIDRFCPGAPSQLNARSAHQAEGLALLWAKRIQVGERQAVRNGAVCGWDTAKINREPIAADELDRYRARQREVELQRKVAKELAEAVKAAQQQADDAAAAALAQRYPGVVATRKPKQTPVADVPGPVATLKGTRK